MLTIPMMVRVGPWTVTGHERVKEWTNCQRCKEPILNVWICEVDPDQIEKLNVLHGQRVWRIGSECWGKLEGLSEAFWKSRRQVAKRHVVHALQFDNLCTEAERAGHVLPEDVLTLGKALLAGRLASSSLRHFRSVMSVHEKALGIGKKRRR